MIQASASTRDNQNQGLYSGATPSEVALALAPLVDFQRDGLNSAELKTLLSDTLLPHLMRYDAPGFQSMFNVLLGPESRLGADIALDFNQGVTNWQVSPGGAVLEELAGQALCRLFGLDEGADATFMYSGTYANQQALYMALHWYAEKRGFNLAERGLAGFENIDRLAVLISADAHFSLRHAARMCGIGEQAIVPLPVDANHRVDIEQMHRIIDQLDGKRDIFCIMPTSGTTSTGSIDPIGAMADSAEKLDAWLHIDGAYGYAYKLVPEWAHLFDGDTRADSISWDPHKQLGAPIPSSMLFVRDGSQFKRMNAFSSYFNREEDVEPNPGLKSIPSTRPFSALPVVTILRGQGLERVVSELRAPLVAIKSLATYLEAQSDFELCHQPDTGILCFRHLPNGLLGEDEGSHQRAIYDHIMASGERSISLTTLNGRMALRVVTVEPHKQFEDFLASIEMIRDAFGHAQDGES